MSNKNCGTCTKCCEGTLKLIVHGEKVSNGKPCPLLNINSGCSDYENRPAMPCKTYRCVWLKNNNIPEHFKPNNVNFIIHRLWIKTYECYTLIPAGKEIKESDIKDIKNWFEENNLNFFYLHEGNHYVSGDDDFLKECYNDKRI